jgi:AcrR family transcriptional regulator
VRIIISQPGSTALEPRPGRPKDPELRARILAATRELLCRDGYAALAMEAIARTADASKPTLYRLWAGKGELVHEAVFGHEAAVPDVDTGSLDGDLRELVCFLVRTLRRPEVRAYFRGAIASPKTDPELAKLQRRRLQEARAGYARVFRRAAARGELSAGFDADTVFFAVYGGVQTWLLLGPNATQRELEDRFFRVAQTLASA